MAGIGHIARHGHHRSTQWGGVFAQRSADVRQRGPAASGEKQVPAAGSQCGSEGSAKSGG